MKLVFAKIGEHQTIRYAFDELVRCFRQMDEQLFIEGRTYDFYDESVEGVIWIGLDGSVAASSDDEIRIDIKDGAGIVTGSNERSVLIASYRLLYELGCRFIRPGKDGEIIPGKSITKKALNIQVAEKASYRHRTVCIEGINSYEHVYNMIDWLPKVGMNGYYMQFLVPYTFFQGRYTFFQGASMPPVFEEDELRVEDVKYLWKSLEEEITKRSLLYHAVGHGWTCEPFGIKSVEWKPTKDEIKPEVKQYFAEVNGKRELCKGKAMETNLCYSNPRARDIMTDAAVDYCRKNPSVDYLQFWLADGANHQCECAECRKMRPADYYVKMLNELDQKLTAAGIDTKVAFTIGGDKLWAPEHCKIENPDRFVLMFAPITRTYSKKFVDFDEQEEIKLAPYVRNKIIQPTSVAENVAYLSGWQKKFSGDSFDFDYHLMWDHILDPGYYECARILHSDMANLDKIGLNGMVSCQVQRAAFPTGLPMYSMAKALWDKTSDFEEIAVDYFDSSFGAEGQDVKVYLSTLSALFHPEYQRLELPQENKEIAEDFIKARKVVEDFKDAYLGKHKEDDKNRSWEYLEYHAEYCMLLADALMFRAMGNKDAETKKLEQVKEYLKSTQVVTHSVLDAQNCWFVINDYVSRG